MYTRQTISIKVPILFILMTVGTLGNGFVAYVIWKTPQLQSGARILLLWLILTDVLVAITGISFTAISQLVAFLLSNDPCQFTKVIGAGFVFSKSALYASIAIMVSITVDRYLAIVHPFYYATMVNERWAKMSVAISWLFSFLTSVIHAAYLTTVDFASCKSPYSLLMECILDNGTYAVGSTIMVAVYGRIFKIAIGQRCKIHHQQVLPYAYNQDDNNRSKREFKTVRTTSMILGSFVVLWFPFEVGRFLQAIGITASYSQYLIDVGMPLGSTNHALNWVIYGLSSSEFRSAVKKFVHIK